MWGREGGGGGRRGREGGLREVREARVPGGGLPRGRPGDRGEALRQQARVRGAEERATAAACGARKLLPALVVSERRVARCLPHRVADEGGVVLHLEDLLLAADALAFVCHRGAGAPATRKVSALLLTRSTYEDRCRTQVIDGRIKKEINPLRRITSLLAHQRMPDCCVQASRYGMHTHTHMHMHMHMFNLGCLRAFVE